MRVRFVCNCIAVLMIAFCCGCGDDEANTDFTTTEEGEAKKQEIEQEMKKMEEEMRKMRPGGR